MRWLRDALIALVLFALLVAVLNLCSYWFDWSVWFFLPFDW